MSNGSLERLLRLAQETGGRVFVHDPVKGRDVVIMDVDEFEELYFGNKKDDTEDLSELELLEQINDNIDSWRSDKGEVVDHKPDLLEDEEDSFLEPNDSVEWHKAGDVLEDKQADEEWGKDETDSGGTFDEDDYLTEQDDEIEIEEISLGLEEPLEEEEKKIIPLNANQEEGQWEEESLGGDEPVFYEEPV